MRPSTAEHTVARYGLERGYFTPAQLAQAEAAAQAAGAPGALLQHLARHLDPAQRAELTGVYQQAQAAGQTVAGLPTSQGSAPTDATVCGPLDPAPAGFGASPVPQPPPPALSASAERSPDTKTPKRIGDYEVVRELGRGGMGVVLEARSLKLDRLVALKLLLDGGANQAIDVARFQIEAKAAARLTHRHIVRLFDHGQDEQGRWYTVLEMIDGESLHERIERDGPLPGPQAAEIARDLASAMAYAHEESILHRDLKPQNVMLDREGVPKLTDFGLAKLVGDASASLTASGHAMGTPAFMAPEQVEGAKDRFDARTDVYGLGATLYYMLAGRGPFVAPSLQELLLAVLDEAPDPLRSVQDGIDRDLERICLKCLEKDPDLRYADAGALRADLDRYLQGHAVAAGPPPATRWLRRHALLVTAGLLLLLLLGVVGVAWTAAQEATREKEAALARLGQPPDPPPTPNQTAAPRKTPAKTPDAKPEPPAKREKRSPAGSTRWTRPVTGQVRAVRSLGPWLVWKEVLRSRRRWVAQRDDGQPIAAPPFERLCWDAPRARLLGVRAGKERTQALVAWTPGTPPRELLQLSGPTTSLTCGPDLLLLGVGRELRAFSLPNPSQPRWKLPLQARLIAAPLWLDLAGKGQHDHALICTTGARALLIRLEDGERVAQVDLPGPVVHAPQPLSPVTSGKVSILAPGCDGRLARLEVTRSRLRVVRTLDVGGPLVGAPAIQRDAGGRARHIFLAQRWVELLAVDPDRFQVRWAGRRSPGHPRGPVGLVDLNRDGSEEVAVSLFDPRARTSRVALYTLQGDRLGDLPATQGVPPYLLAGSNPLLVCGGDQVLAWGPWEQLPAKQPRPAGWAEAQLLAGAWVRASEGAKSLSGIEAEVITALASYYRQEPSLLHALRQRDEGAAFRVVDRLARSLAPPLALNRLLKPFGRSLDRGPLKPRPTRPWRRAPAALAGLRLTKRAPLASNLTLRIGGLVTGPGQQPCLVSGARLEVTFRFAKRHPAILELEHKTFKSSDLGNVCLRVTLDGQQVAHRWVPGRKETARISLGLLTATQHRIQVEVDRSLTLYRLVQLRIVAR